MFRMELNGACSDPRLHVELPRLGAVHTTNCNVARGPELPSGPMLRVKPVPMSGSNGLSAICWCRPGKDKRSVSASIRQASRVLADGYFCLSDTGSVIAGE